MDKQGVTPRPKRGTGQSRAGPRTSDESSQKRRAARESRRADEQRALPNSDDLSELQIGARVKHARMLKGIRMRELAKLVGCTESMISKIESGRVIPSLPMMNRLTKALDRDIASFFGLYIETQSVVQSQGKRPISSTDPIRKGRGIRYERLVPFAAGSLLEANIHIIEPGGEKIDDITHQGEALGFLLEGEIEVNVDGSAYPMRAGDSFFFKAHLPSSYRNTGTTIAKLIWVNTPQVH
jgi:transcriptional regulator with XRE-family HTH domain